MRKEGTVEKKVKKVTKIKQQQKGGTETLREATMAIEIKYDTLKTKIKEVKKKKKQRTVCRSARTCSVYVYQVQRLTRQTLNVPTGRDRCQGSSRNRNQIITPRANRLAGEGGYQ